MSYSSRYTVTITQNSQGRICSEQVTVDRVRGWQPTLIVLLVLLPLAFVTYLLTTWMAQTSPLAGLMVLLVCTYVSWRLIDTAIWLSVWWYARHYNRLPPWAVAKRTAFDFDLNTPPNDEHP